MSRYVFSAVNLRGECVEYLESTSEEDKKDMTEELVCVGFTGNGYLDFWKRCKESVADSTADGIICTITDTYTGEEKQF